MSESNRKTVGQYTATDRGIVWHKPSRDSESADVRLTNFRAEIRTETRLLDGAETRHVYEIECVVGNRTTVLVVPAETGESLRWVSQLGSRAILSPGQGHRGRIWHAIQTVSDADEHTAFAHTGWADVEGVDCYLHGEGATGPDGNVSSVDVRLDDTLARMVLPEPPGAEQLTSDAARVFSNMWRIAPPSVMAPALAHAWCAAAGIETECSIWVYGLTGSRKSELAARVQQLFGARWSRARLPENWSSTENALEGLLFAAKDVLVTIDDFVPGAGDPRREHQKCDRILRAVGERRSRGRLHATLERRASRPPRAAVLATGEELPGTASARARCLCVELGAGNQRVDDDRLTLAQADGEECVPARFMAGFVQWLAECRRDKVEPLELAPEINTALGEGATGAHKRTEPALRTAADGWRIVLAFMADRALVSPQQLDELRAEVEDGLVACGRRQTRIAQAACPAQKFVKLLASAIARGDAHLELATSVSCGGDQSSDARSLRRRCGWRDSGPQGKQVGWYDSETGLAHLQPTSAVAVARDLGARTADPLTSTERAIMAALAERGMSVVGGEAGRTTNRVKIQGRTRKRVLSLSLSLLLDEEGEP